MIEPAGAVAQDVHPRLGHGREQPAGHRPGVHRQLAVHRGDDDVEPVQHLRLLVQGAVVEDVDLDAGQQPEVPEPFVDRRDQLELLAQPSRREPVGHLEPGRVVGQRQVVVPELDRRHRHLLDRAAAVAPGRVRVQVTAQRRPHRLPAGRQRPGVLLQTGEVRRGRTVQRLAHDGRGLGPDAGDRGERAVGRPAPYLVLAGREQRGRRARGRPAPGRCPRRSARGGRRCAAGRRPARSWAQSRPSRGRPHARHESDGWTSISRTGHWSTLRGRSPTLTDVTHVLPFLVGRRHVDLGRTRSMMCLPV